MIVMMAITHLTTALTFGSLPLLFGMTTDYGQESLLYFGAVALGALIVDIDEPNSAFGRKFLPLSMALKSLVGHRTVTHNLIAAIIGFVASAIFHNFTALGFFLGMSVHVLGDAFTGNVKGALAPFTNKFYLLPKSMLFRVGSPVEYLVLLVSSILFMYEHYVNIQKVVL